MASQISDDDDSAAEYEPSTRHSEESFDINKDVPLGERIGEQQNGVTSKHEFLGKGSRENGLKKYKLSAYSLPKAKFKRENKNRPVEQSSKKPVPRFREVIEGHGRRSMDPRFDDLAGKFKEDTFKKRYSFLFDEQLPQEKLQLKKKLKVSKNADRKQELQAQLTRVEQQIKAEHDRRRKRANEQAGKVKEKEAVKLGKQPFFMKKSEKKKQELVRRYQELKASGGLEKAMAKKRRKNAAKDHRYVPESRR